MYPAIVDSAGINVLWVCIKVLLRRCWILVIRRVSVTVHLIKDEVSMAVRQVTEDHFLNAVMGSALLVS